MSKIRHLIHPQVVEKMPIPTSYIRQVEGDDFGPGIHRAQVASKRQSWWIEGKPITRISSGTRRVGALAGWCPSVPPATVMAADDKTMTQRRRWRHPSDTSRGGLLRDGPYMSRFGICPNGRREISRHLTTPFPAQGYSHLPRKRLTLFSHNTALGKLNGGVAELV